MKAAPSARKTAHGHTLIELMVAILVGIILILAASVVMATFEARKRTTTAMNDALQSANIGMLVVDTMIRSSGTGLRQYAAASGGYGCVLNYNYPFGGTTAVAGGALPSLKAPFNVAGLTLGSGATPLRLVPIVVFPGVTSSEGTISGVPAAATAGQISDVFLVMLGGGGYGEAPVIVNRMDPGSGDLLVSTTIGFSANESVLVSPPATGGPACFITTIAPAFSGYTGATNYALPLANSAIGGKTIITSIQAATGTYVVAGLGMNNGTIPAASFYLYGIGNTTDSTVNSLYSLDLLNDPGGSPQPVSDDVVFMKVAYGVDPGNTGLLTWVLPQKGVAVSGNIYDYSPPSPTGLLSGTTGTATSADMALKSIHAVRVAMVVRAPLLERFTAAGRTAIGANNAINDGSYTIFASINSTAVATSQIPKITWTPPAVASGGNYRYREIEATIPLRNSGTANAAL